jgi:hypothetical protein
MYSPNIRDDLIPLLYRLARQEGKPMTRLVDEILRAEVERRVSQGDQQTNPDTSGSLKKTLGERRTEKISGREKVPVGLRPPFLSSPMEQHPDPDSKWEIVMS